MPTRVLVADDSPTIRRRASSTLSEAGYDVTCVEDGQAAWTHLQSGTPYAVLLCDILMPAIDGYELCRRVKSDARLAALPVLLLRGTFEPWDQGKAVDAGADGYITKPFDSEALLSTLSEVLSETASAPAPIAAPPEAEAEPDPEPVAEAAAAAAASSAPDEPLFAPVADMETTDTREFLAPSETALAAPAPPVAPAAPEPAAEPEPAAPLAPLGSPFEPEPIAIAGGDEVFGSSEPAGPLAADADDPFGSLAAAPVLHEPAATPLPSAPLSQPLAAPPSEPSAAPRTAPMGQPPVAPHAAPSPAGPGATVIDEALIERIAERVAARLTGRELERIAWEVVPDVAEALVKRRLAEIEAQLGDEA